MRLIAVIAMAAGAALVFDYLFAFLRHFFAACGFKHRLHFGLDLHAEFAGETVKGLDQNGLGAFLVETFPGMRGIPLRVSDGGFTRITSLDFLTAVPIVGVGLGTV